MSDAVPLFEEAVASLTRYFVGDQTLGETLHQVAELTTQAVSVADHVGITLLVDGKLKTSMFTHPEVQIDRANTHQRWTCVNAYRTGIAYMIDSTREPGRWQEFRDSAERHGVMSTVVVAAAHSRWSDWCAQPYSEIEHAFDEAQRRVAELFATQAAFVLANVQAYWDARSLSENLTQAMESRAVIEQAKGIIMSTMRCDPDAAWQLLETQSQAQNIKIREIATEIVNNASRPTPGLDD